MPRRARKPKRPPSAEQEEVSPSRVVRAWLWSAGVAVALFLVYLAGLIPTVVDQDSGELVSACHVLGIAHPTGYPLWVMLGRLFDLLPVGHTSAYRVALLSAASAAAAGGLITLCGLRLTGRVIPGLGAGLWFGLWYPTWSQAVRAEVYGLTALLFAFVLLGLLQWSARQTWRSVYCLALAAGFVAMHHRTAFLASLPPLLTAAWLTRPRRFSGYLTTGLLFFAPFAFYIYLPIRAAARPPVNWTDPVTLDRFLAHVMGSQYAHFAFDHSLEQMWEQGVKLLPDLLAASAPLAVALAVVGLPFIAWGWWRWWRRDRAGAGSLAAGAALLSFWVLQWGETTDLKVFLLPLGAILAVCGGLGIAELEKRVGRPLVGGIVVGALIAALVGANWSRADLSNRWGYRDQWAAVLMQMKPDAIFVSDFDVPTFATKYLQNVERLRTDITLLDTVGVMQPWYVNLIADDELRSAVQDAWREVNREIPITATGTSEFWHGSALFARLLAEHYRGKRPVYALHGPVRPVEEPPYFVGLSHDLVEVTFRDPVNPVPLSSAPQAEFPGIGDLERFSWGRREAGNGEVVQFSADWRVAALSASMQFVIALVPKAAGAPPDGPAAQWQDECRLAQAFPLAYGLSDLTPTPQDKACRQRGAFIIPSNAPPGDYRTYICVTPLYAQEFSGWRDTGAVIHITHRPLPSNGP